MEGRLGVKGLGSLRCFREGKVAEADESITLSLFGEKFVIGRHFKLMIFSSEAFPVDHCRSPNTLATHAFPQIWQFHCLFRNASLTHRLRWISQCGTLFML